MKTDKLFDALVEVATSATFTPEALARYQKMLERVKDLETDLETSRKECAGYRRTSEDYLSRLNEHIHNRDKIALREEAVTKREAEMLKLEMRAAVAEAKEGVRKEVFETIFRNTVVKRNFTDAVSSSGYTPAGSTNKTETHTVNETVEEG